ncbi:DNA exonuclease A [Aeromonas phage ZPAH1]|nr:DNA exonuclease A [Aeromonas phage Aswh_1]QQG33958.1 DNA exonuclease A [Aeromonas phage ZPAH1]
MDPITDYLIDFESLNTVENAILVEFSIIPFIMDPSNTPNFNELVACGKKFKFNIKSQKYLGRTYSQSTLAWWKKQGDAAKLLLKPSSEDKSLYESAEELRQFFLDTGVKFKKSHIWTRGEMDVVWLRSWFSCVYHLKDDEVTDNMPVMFNNFREVRTAIESNLSRDVTYCPLPVGSLPGFTKHNSLHDAARDVMMLLYSKRYSYGLEPIPTDVDPNSQRG